MNRNRPRFKYSKLFMGVSVFALLNLPLALTSYAADQGSESAAVLEEVTVTARRRSENLQEVPIAVSVITDELIQDAGLTDIKELQFLNPSLTLRDGNVDRGVGFVMRGVGTRSFNTGIEPSVNVVIDGVVNGIQAQNIADLADIERIEILRGPQGTLFGKNSTAGVVSITTKAPSEELEGNLSVGYGSNEEVKIKGTISNSLSDNVGARLSFYSNSTDGYLDNVSTGPKNEIDEYGLRGKVVFNMSDDNSLRVTANYSDRDSNCCYWVARVAAPDSGFANRIAPVIASETNNEINLANDFSQFNDITSTGISVQYDSAFNAFDLVAIAAWSDWDSDVNTDVDSSPVDLIDINGGLFTSQHKTFELRLQSNGSTELQWLAGYFYADQFNDGKQDIGSFTSLLLGNPETPSNFGTLTEFEQDITNWAVFGDLTFAVSETVDLTVGVRYSDKKGDGQTQNSALPGFDAAAFFRPPSALQKRSVDDDNVSGRVIVRWRPGSETMVYASATRGYKGPGLLEAQVEDVDAEIPTSFELGVKSNFLDQRLRVAATLFKTDYADFQAQSLALDEAGDPKFFFNNADELETSGLELEFDFLATSNLMLSAQLAVIDAEFTDFDNAPCYAGQTEALGCSSVAGFSTQSLNGKSLPLAPDTSYTLSARYDFQFLGADAHAYASYAYRSETEGDLNNPDFVIDSFGLLNANIGANFREGKYSVMVWGKNLTDEFYVTRIFNTFGGGTSHYVSPNSKRRFGVTASYNF